MTEGPRAIETIYNGYRFRSRLEARWAVFLDAIGVEYEYEKEGYDLGSGVYYLPDFYIANPGYWLEIKPFPPTRGDESWIKAALLAEKTDLFVCVTTTSLQVRSEAVDVLMFAGGVPYMDYPENCHPSMGWWVTCPSCHVVQPFDNDWMSPCGCMFFTPNDQRAREAMVYARQARFEFGQTPRGPRDR